MKAKDRSITTYVLKRDRVFLVLVSMREVFEKLMSLTDDKQTSSMVPWRVYAV